MNLATVVQTERFLYGFLFVLVVAVAGSSLVLGGELTFELPDNEKFCFHEVINKDEQCTLEFQVLDLSYFLSFVIVTSLIAPF